METSFIQRFPKKTYEDLFRCKTPESVKRIYQNILAGLLWQISVRVMCENALDEHTVYKTKHDSISSL